MNEREPKTRLDLADPDMWLAGPPHDEFARLRSEAPVAWNERLDGQAGYWVVTRHDDIVTVSRDTTTFSSRHGVISLDDFDDDQNESRRTLLEMDPPQHTMMRKVTSRSFTPRAVSAFESFIRATSGRLIDEALGRCADEGSVDFVEALAKQVPILTLCRLLGVPPERRDDMIRWSDALIGSDDPEYVDPAVEAVPEAERRLLPFGHPFSLEAFDLGLQLAQARRAAAGATTANGTTDVASVDKHSDDDIVSALALGEVDGRRLSDQEYCNYFLMLVVAGNETTRHSLSHGLMSLADHPDQWHTFRDGVRAGTVDANVAADEILRWASAVHFVRRVATVDTVLNGANIRAGDKVAMYYGSANRDAEHFDDPYEFHLDRSPNNHVAFGRGGPHFCLGAHLARLQIRVFLEELARRVDTVGLAGRVDRLRSNHIHGIKHLPVRLTASAARTTPN